MKDKKLNSINNNGSFQGGAAGRHDSQKPTANLNPKQKSFGKDQHKQQHQQPQQPSYGTSQTNPYASHKKDERRGK